MGKTKFLIAAALVIGLVVTGCAGRVPVHTDDAYPIEVGVNRKFLIVVTIDPTDVYFWEQEFDETKLELIESICVICAADVQSTFNIVGPNNQFRYRALAAGETEISMTNRRPSDSAVLDQKVFKVEIK